MHLQYDDALIKEVLENTRVIAMVGASPKPHRDSHHVMAYLQKRGYKVIPVNPMIAGETLLGEKVYGALEDIPTAVDMVEIFRNTEQAAEACEQAIKIKAKYVWMQLGVINAEAARHATGYGIKVIMDRCPAIEIPRLGLDK